jgi:hypothetical protein
LAQLSFKLLDQLVAPALDFILPIKQFPALLVALCFKIALFLLRLQLVGQGSRALAFGARFLDLPVKVFDLALKADLQIVSPRIELFRFLREERSGCATQGR